MILVDPIHAAALLLELRESGRTVPELPDGLRPAGWEEAYAIQDELHHQGGWETGALKVGCTSERAQKALGIDAPIAGRVPAPAVVSSGATLQRWQFHHQPLLECEFAIRVGQDIALGEPLDDFGLVRSLADAVAPAIELVDTRFDDALGASTYSTVADNSAAAGLVLGQAVAPIPDNLAEVEVVLSSGGTELAKGTGAAVLGDPLLSFQWALQHELARGRAIPVGTWVITGTCTGLLPCPEGSVVTAEFAGLGEVEFSISA